MLSPSHLNIHAINKKKKKKTSQTAWCALILEWALWVADCSCAVEVILQSLIALMPETLKWMRWGNHLMLCWKTTKPACFKSTNNRWWRCSLIFVWNNCLIRQLFYFLTVWSVFSSVLTVHCSLCNGRMSVCRAGLLKDRSTKVSSSERDFLTCSNC